MAWREVDKINAKQLSKHGKTARHRLYVCASTAETAAAQITSDTVVSHHASPSIRHTHGAINEVPPSAVAYILVMGKSIRIDSRCRIVMKNFDSVCSYNALATVRASLCCKISRPGSHSRQYRHSLLLRQLEQLCCNAGRPVIASVDWSSSFRTRVQKPWCGLSRGVLTEH